MILSRFSAVSAGGCLCSPSSSVFIHSSYAVHVLLYSSFRMFPRYMPISISLSGRLFGLGVLHGFARNSPLSFQAPTRQFKISSIGPSFSLWSIFGTQAPVTHQRQGWTTSGIQSYGILPARISTVSHLPRNTSTDV